MTNTKPNALSAKPKASTRITSAPVHRILCLSGNQADIEGQLNSLSIDGWTIHPVSIYQTGSTITFVGVAKRNRTGA